MSYDGIKTQLVKRMGSLGFRESKQAWDFENASAREYENTFIVRIIEGAKEDGNSLINKFLDTQLWQIQIAYSKSAQNDVLQRDKMNRKINEITGDLDDPTNWQGITNGAVNQEYRSWEITDVGDYFLLTITLGIMDRVTY